ncbi:MAG: DUF4364 family protein [Oscillospiraceae bacterium]|jgi:hypothetical protein|nr:DUF4364 family protein [Oscillospiraceae bacterium]
MRKKGKKLFSPGQIRTSAQVKFLTLYCANRLPYPTTIEKIYEAISVDRGFGYFDVVQAVSGLIETGHAEEVSYFGSVLYRTTKRGQAHGAIVERDVPRSVRNKADPKIAALAKSLKLEHMVKTFISAKEPRSEV